MLCELGRMFNIVILWIINILVLALSNMHLVQIHGFCFIVEFIALILLLLYVFDYYFNIFFHILICKYISLIINLFYLKWYY